MSAKASVVARDLIELRCEPCDMNALVSLPPKSFRPPSRSRSRRIRVRGESLDCVMLWCPFCRCARSCVMPARSKS